jgi:hypothetical protein
MKNDAKKKRAILKAIRNEGKYMRSKRKEELLQDVKNLIGYSEPIRIKVPPAYKVVNLKVEEAFGYMEFCDIALDRAHDNKLESIKTIFAEKLANYLIEKNYVSLEAVEHYRTNLSTLFRTTLRVVAPVSDGRERIPFDGDAQLAGDEYVSKVAGSSPPYEVFIPDVGAASPWAFLVNERKNYGK